MACRAALRCRGAPASSSGAPQVRRRTAVLSAAGTPAQSPSVGGASAYEARLLSALGSKFDAAAVARVRESLELTLAGREFHADHGDEGPQEAHSYVRGLQASPWHDPSEHAWARALAAEWETPARELRASLDPAQADKLRQRGYRVWAPAAREEGAAYGEDWRTLVLMDRGSWDEANAAMFPETVELIKRAGVPAQEVFFAKQPAGTGIAPHTDGCNFVMTSHLGLDVPHEDERCWMRVGKDKRPWANGGILMCDTSFEHETYNDAETDRYVLLIRHWHHDLTKTERKALQWIFDALADASMPPGKVKVRKATNSAAKAKAKRKGFGAKS